MRKLLIALLLAPVVAWGAERVGTFDAGIVVTLYDTPCGSKEILALLKPDSHKFYQAGKVTAPAGVFGPKPLSLPLCWRVSPNDPSTLFVVDQDGDGGAVPISAFAPKGTRIDKK